MPVWLASYPRSGNTLLRQVLKACFNLDSCEGLEPIPARESMSDGVRNDFYGSFFIEGDPEEFYRQAKGNPGLVLIKSHQAPRDDAKAIYVVRDGRMALKSYVKFQDTFHSGQSSYESLLLGDHAYGDWSCHYRRWCEERSGETLVIRFEDLVSADTSLLTQLASFLNYTGPVRPWVNPQAKLRELDPNHFGAGESVWRPASFWTESRLQQFYTLHGSLLVQLGYATPAEVESGAYPTDSDEERLLRFAHNLATNRGAIQNVCDERLVEIARLSTACNERLDLINHLTNECKERNQIISALRRERALKNQIQQPEPIQTEHTKSHQVREFAPIQLLKRFFK